MKKNLLKILFVSLILTACSSDSDSDPVNTNPESTCSNVTSFNVTQNEGQLNLTVQTASNPLYTELSAVPAGGQNNPDYGNIEIINGTSKTLQISDSNYLQPGNTYLFYMRTVCANETKSGWSTPISLSISNYCGMPYNLNVVPEIGGPKFIWENTDSDNTYYETQYGPHGFALGNGISSTLDGTFIQGMPLNGNTTYDFYVRSYCNAALGWSDWAGPYTYFSSSNSNLCTAPSNITYTMETSSAANIRWDYNGESHFEYALISGSETIDTVTLHQGFYGEFPTFTGLSHWGSYTFYVRAVCSDGGHTSWTTRPINID